MTRCSRLSKDSTRHMKSLPVVGSPSRPSWRTRKARHEPTGKGSSESDEKDEIFSRDASPTRPSRRAAKAQEILPSKGPSLSGETWTAAMDTRLLALNRQKLPSKDMAKLVNRTHESVMSRLSVLKVRRVGASLSSTALDQPLERIDFKTLRAASKKRKTKPVKRSSSKKTKPHYPTHEAYLQKLPGWKKPPKGVTPWTEEEDLYIKRAKSQSVWVLEMAINLKRGIRAVLGRAERLRLGG